MIDIDPTILKGDPGSIGRDSMMGKKALYTSRSVLIQVTIAEDCLVDEQVYYVGITHYSALLPLQQVRQGELTSIIQQNSCGAEGEHSR